MGNKKKEPTKSIEKKGLRDKRQRRSVVKRRGQKPGRGKMDHLLQRRVRGSQTLDRESYFNTGRIHALTSRGQQGLA